MKLQFLEKMTKKAVSTASVAAKDEVRKTAVGLIPKIFGLAAMGLGIFLFKEAVVTPETPKPVVTRKSVTTNNYFFQTMSEDAIKRIMEGK